MSDMFRDLDAEEQATRYKGNGPKSCLNSVLLEGIVHYTPTTDEDGVTRFGLMVETVASSTVTGVEKTYVSYFTVYCVSSISKALFFAIEHAKSVPSRAFIRVVGKLWVDGDYETCIVADHIEDMVRAVKGAVKV
jgi:hypothetical protein